MREAADSNLALVSLSLGAVKTLARSLSSTKQSNELTRRVMSDCIEIILLPRIYSILVTRRQCVNANTRTLPVFTIHPTSLNCHIFVPYPCPPFFHPHLQSLSLLQSILLARPMLLLALLTCTMQQTCCCSVRMLPEKSKQQPRQMHHASTTGSLGGTRPPDPLPYPPELLVLPLQIVYLLIHALNLKFCLQHLLIVSGTIDVVAPLLPLMVGSLSTMSARIAGLIVVELNSASRAPTCCGRNGCFCLNDCRLCCLDHCWDDLVRHG